MTQYISVSNTALAAKNPTFELREPLATDAAALHRLIAASPPLDANSLYCNLLHCTHFSATSVAATGAGELVGFVSGYRVPDQPRTLFVWQVVVSPTARKHGLAQRMLREILSRSACRQMEFLHTTITADNTASRALFAALARELSAPLAESVWFEREQHFAGAHADEILLRIGPLRGVNGR